MKQLLNKKKIGLPPGSIVFTGEKKVEDVFIHYLEYDEESIQGQALHDEKVQAIHQPIEKYVQWYDVRGLHDTQLIEELGQTFQVHSLALEDVVDINQRPKLDEYDEGIFITLKAFTFNKTSQEVVFEQVAFYLGDGFLLSFQERADDLFKNIRERLQKAKGRIRKKKADYLLYILLDNIIEQYYFGLEGIEENIEDLEINIIESANNNNYRTKIYALKQEMLKIRKAVVPLRELTNAFKELEGELIEEKTMLYLRDLKDHIIQTIDLIETYRDNLNSLQDLYLSELSYRMNNVMQVLAVVSTIFIPLTFIAGVYGMNFDHIPELHWKNGYFLALSIMLSIALMMLWFFRKRKWL